MVYFLKKILTLMLLPCLVLVAFTLVFSLMFLEAESADALSLSPSIAVEISEPLRTVLLNDSGDQTTLSLKQLSVGQRQFNSTCVQCHLDGGSKTNPDVDLSTEILANAIPARNNLESLVDYLHSPTTYDGLGSLADFHPSTESADLFPRMKALSESDLRAIAGYILTEPNIIGDQWAGGKPKR